MEGDIDMSKEIEFIYVTEHSYNAYLRPEPAKTFIPEWYKDLQPYKNGKFGIHNGVTNATAKKCTPLLDGMVTGYIVPLWADVYIEDIENRPSISWTTSVSVFQKHDESATLMPPPDGYSKHMVKYVSSLTVRTPKGYSILVTQPSGYQDSPFRTVPAIIDTDTDKILDLPFPIWVKEGYTGIVEKGTPLVQIIPFKRDDWKSKFSFMTGDELRVRADRSFNSVIKNHYTKFVWKKKDFK